MLPDRSNQPLIPCLVLSYAAPPPCGMGLLDNRLDIRTRFTRISVPGAHFPSAAALPPRRRWDRWGHPDRTARSRRPGREPLPAPFLL